MAADAVTTFDAPTTLDNMVLIVEAEMLIHLDYVTNEVMDQERERKGAICGGRKACAIGALWLAHGIKPEVWGDDDEAMAQLPGITYDERLSFMLDYPELRKAYDALDSAAEEKADAIAQRNGAERIGLFRPEIVRQAQMCGMAEALFESRLLDQDFVGKELIDVIDRAKELLAPAE